MSDDTKSGCFNIRTHEGGFKVARVMLVSVEMVADSNHHLTYEVKYNGGSWHHDSLSDALFQASNVASFIDNNELRREARKLVGSK